MEQLPILTGRRIATREEVRLVAEAISLKFHPERIILFGSYAWGKPDPESDVDLLVIVNASASNWDASVDISATIRHSFPMDIIVQSAQEIAERMRLGDFFLTRVVGTSFNRVTATILRAPFLPRWAPGASPEAGCLQ